MSSRFLAHICWTLSDQSEPLIDFTSALQIAILYFQFSKFSFTFIPYTNN